MDRAILFVDGSNWYHGCASLGLEDLGRLDFARVSRRLVRHRDWLATRYYVGRVPESVNRRLAASQQRFLRFLRSCDPRIAVRLGRIEPREARSEAAAELRRYLADLRFGINPTVYRDLPKIATKYAVARVMVEKSVDVQIAVDMVVMAERNEYETAYLLSADSDLTPAVEVVVASGKQVFVASPLSGARLASVCSSYIRLEKPWFSDVYSSGPRGLGHRA